MEAITLFFESFLKEDIELAMPNGSFRYTLQDLEYALDFALISEGILKSDKVFNDMNILKVRLHSLVNGEYKQYFEVEKYLTKEN